MKKLIFWFVLMCLAIIGLIVEYPKIALISIGSSILSYVLFYFLFLKIASKTKKVITNKTYFIRPSRILATLTYVIVNVSMLSYINDLKVLFIIIDLLLVFYCILSSITFILYIAKNKFNKVVDNKIDDHNAEIINNDVNNEDIKSF